MASRRLIGPAERDFLVDAVMLSLAVVAQILTAPAAQVPVPSFGWLIAFPVAMLILLAWRGMYGRRAGLTFLDDLRTVVAATAVAAMIVTFVRVLFVDDAFAASQTVRDWLFAVVYLTAGRGAVHIVELKLRASGVGRPTLIVGAGRIGHLLARRLLQRPEIGLQPVGFVDDDPLEAEETPGCPVLGKVSQLDAVVEEYGIEHAILSFSRASHEEALAVSRRLRGLRVSVSVVPRLFEDIPDRMTLDRVGGFPLLSIHPSNPRSWQFKVKYALDRAFAALAILIFSPLLIAVALGVLLTMGRPIFFRQRRVGLDGRNFDMLKFRTMTGNPESDGEADAAWAADITGVEEAGANGSNGSNGSTTAVPAAPTDGAVTHEAASNGVAVDTVVTNGASSNGAATHAETTDGAVATAVVPNRSAPNGANGASPTPGRTTRFGSLLRRASLDEVPQIFNVLRGEMSVVGPRPERRSYVDLFEGSVQRYADRHRVKSGMTGWAQVHGLRGKTSLSDRVEWDNYYIENWSLWLDCKILLLTVLAVFHDHRGDY
jgi:lipopolysaccharide/colanic/teichoic acid biosynthesis glycosyltransferase